MNTTRLAPLLFLAGCGGPEPIHPNQPLWDADGAVATADGLYMQLPQWGQGAYIAADGTLAQLDIGDGSLEWIAAVPGTDRVVGLVRRYGCDTDEGNPKFVHQCWSENRIADGTLLVFESGDVVANVPFGPNYGSPTLSPDGRYLLSFIDADDLLSDGGPVRLQGLGAVDLVDGVAWSIDLAVTEAELLFPVDGDGVVSNLVVVTDREASMVSLADRDSAADVVYPLTLSATDASSPSSASLDASGDSALVTVAGSADLFSLDLVQPSVNLVALLGEPAATAMSALHGKTLFTFGSSDAQLVSHDGLGTVEIALDQSKSAIATASDVAVLYDEGDEDELYRVDWTDGTAETYVVSHRVDRLEITPDGAFAASFTDDYDSSRMEVLDLRADDDGDLDTSPEVFALDSGPVDVLTEVVEGSAVFRILEGYPSTLTTYTPELGAFSTVDVEGYAERVVRLADGGPLMVIAEHEWDSDAQVHIIDSDGDVLTVDDVADFGKNEGIRLTVGAE